MSTHPVLYSFRRCPYAMRARMALCSAGITVELREIVLKNKPAEMLAISPKGTVPVLQLPDGEVIEESIQIMRWALQQNDPENWLTADPEITQKLIADNDDEFKHWLDRYKYFERYPEHSQEHYRQQACQFLEQWDKRLASNNGQGLVAARTTLADIALLPFVRQLAHTDLKWFDEAPYPALRNHLLQFKQSAAFGKVMKKWPEWDAAEQEKNYANWQ